MTTRRTAAWRDVPRYTVVWHAGTGVRLQKCTETEGWGEEAIELGLPHIPKVPMRAGEKVYLDPPQPDVSMIPDIVGS